MDIKYTLFTRYTKRADNNYSEDNRKSGIDRNGDTFLCGLIFYGKIHLHLWDTEYL